MKEFVDVIKVPNQLTFDREIILDNLGRADSIRWKALRAEWRLSRREEILPVDNSFSPCLTVPACPSWWRSYRFRTCLASQFLAINLLIYILYWFWFFHWTLTDTPSNRFLLFLFNLFYVTYRQVMEPHLNHSVEKVSISLPLETSGHGEGQP